MSLLYLVKESARAIRRGGDGQSRTHCAPSPTRCDALCIRRTATAAPGTHTHNLPLIGAAITICDCPGQDAPQRRTKRAFQQRVDQLEEEACARACRAHLCPCAATIALCTEPPPPPTPPPAQPARPAWARVPRPPVLAWCVSIRARSHRPPRGKSRSMKLGSPK